MNISSNDYSNQSVQEESKIDLRNDVISTSDSNREVFDGGKSSNVLSAEDYSEFSSWRYSSNADWLKMAMHKSNLYTGQEIKNKLYTETFRFGNTNLRSGLASGREYLFFTKPDLNILTCDPASRLAGPTSILTEYLRDIPFWRELYNTRKDTTIKCLQMSYDNSDPFNHMLQNHVISNLDIPGLNAELIDTPTNAWGVNYSYRGSSEGSDDTPEFSLEFKDNRYLDTFLFFKAYEEYETLKHHGVLAPQQWYILDKILHDQFAIYKFIVADDMETIVYYGKMYGVFPKSLPRDTFSTANFDDGIKYSVDFKAAFYEDMKPDILADFNKLSANLYNQQPYQIYPYNITTGAADTRPAKAAAVIKDTTSALARSAPGGYVYKLKWRGSDTL